MSSERLLLCVLAVSLNVVPTILLGELRMHSTSLSPKRAWPSSATVAFSTAVANVKPLSAHAGDAFVDKGIVYLQPGLADDVKSFMESVAPAKRYSWLVSYDADGDADLSEVLEVRSRVCDEYHQ